MKFIGGLVVTVLACSCTVKPMREDDAQALPVCSPEVIAEPVEQPIACPEFPFDMSGSACDVAGWQSFVYSQLISGSAGTDVSQNKTAADRVKHLIVLSHPYQPLAVRAQATEQLMEESFEHLNAFGDFLYVLANYYTQLNNLEQQSVQQQSALKHARARSDELEKQLADTKAKIEAIMEIEQDLSTEQETLGVQ